jgi:hypothetical protein
MCLGGGLCALLYAGKTDYKCGTQFNMCAACCFLCIQVQDILQIPEHVKKISHFLNMFNMCDVLSVFKYSHHLGPVIPNFSCFGPCVSGLMGFNDDYSFLKC